MLGRSTGATLVGVEAALVEVEVHVAGGLPSLAAVGLPAPSVREGLDRIRAALHHAGLDLPPRRVIVNLAPAGLRKSGAGLDLPIAAALMAAHESGGRPGPPGTVLCGELGLDGTVRPVRGVLSAALAARDDGRPRILVPRENAAEAALVEGIEVVAVSSLADVVALAHGTATPRPEHVDARDILAAARADTGPDLRDVRGQPAARRAVEVAAAGGHNLLLLGPPGSGKTMLARRMPGILPPLTPREALEITRVWSVAGLARGLVTRRPFRAPHHGVSAAALVGGGTSPRPGEVTLAVHGVLFLDELPEFRRDALEALRQPLEEGRVTITRVEAVATFPARFCLVAAMNPCPCGYHGGSGGRCRCSPLEVRRYRSKVSGPLLDRFDLLVEAPPVRVQDLARGAQGEDSVAVRRRVEAARLLQVERTGSAATANAALPDDALDRDSPLVGRAGASLLADCRRLGLSARGFGRVRRLARTLADLDGTPLPQARHFLEAAALRLPLERFLQV